MRASIDSYEAKRVNWPKPQARRVCLGAAQGLLSLGTCITRFSSLEVYDIWYLRPHFIDTSIHTCPQITKQKKKKKRKSK